VVEPSAPRLSYRLSRLLSGIVTLSLPLFGALLSLVPVLIFIGLWFTSLLHRQQLGDPVEPFAPVIAYLFIFIAERLFSRFATE
jgi:hypothetical protein